MRKTVVIASNNAHKAREIAEALGLRESAVQTSLLRARQKLRQKLEGWNDD